jgi:hypothetical protein
MGIECYVIHQGLVLLLVARVYETWARASIGIQSRYP